MAYLFRGAFKDIENRSFNVDIYRYGETDPLYEIQYSAPDPVIISHRGGNKDEWDDEIIIGTELSYTFFLPFESEDLVDEILDAEYGYYYLSLWYNGEVEIFRGILKPENMVVDFLGNPDYITLTVTATDGLGDLKEIAFRNPDVLDYAGNPSLYEGKKTLLEVIQLACKPIENLAVDCVIVMSTYENTYMTYEECAFEKIYINCERFFEYNDKGVDVLSCYDVLQTILKPFNCKLFQTAGGIKIINYYEDIGTYRFDYTGDPWTFQAKTIFVNNVDISDYLFYPGIERQKIQPIKQLKTIFRNNDIGDSVTNSDLMDVATYTHSFSSAEVNSEGNMSFFSEHTAEHRSDYIQLASDFNLPADQVPCYLKIEIEYRIQDLVHGGGTPEFQLGWRVKRPVNGGEWSPIIKESPLYIINNNTTPTALFVNYESGGYRSLEMIVEGDYNVQLVLSSKAPHVWDWTSLYLEIRSMRIRKIASGSPKDFGLEEESIDQDFTQENDTGIEFRETEILLADGNATTEVGALLASGTDVTIAWTRLARLESIKLIDAYTRNILANRSAYKNFLRFTIIDRDMTLSFLNTLSITRNLTYKRYCFSSFSQNIRMCEIEAEMVELILESGISA